jgi:superfamily II RNA helicase
MVKICEQNYPAENEEKYKEYYSIFKYPLHSFQKWAIESTILGHHTLVCCPTGSGKSAAAEFAIHYFHSIGKKVIYCSPIKSLSNQKFADFKEKYPHISIGIKTGDISCNTEADVVIMTTEILCNFPLLGKVEQKGIQTDTSVFCSTFSKSGLGAVIFDEIHMINDPDRGKVWEQAIMMLPPSVQIIGLSATLDNPERFAKWIEDVGASKDNNEGARGIYPPNDGARDQLAPSPPKEVYLTTKKDRIVPLIHYSFITAPTGIFKAVKDKTLQAEIRSIIGKPFVIQSAKGEFMEQHYHKMIKMLKLFETNHVRIKRQHVLNEVAQHLVENEMLPALCYVFSRKQLEICAKEMTTNLLEFDSKIPYTIDRECEQIMRKMPNYLEYLNLPEYIHLVSLLQKGVAIHHSGMIPILKEIVEILFAKGSIKLLFCTESVAIGLNLPVKTAIFTDISKHDGHSLRMLHAHEYTQAAGRAGRLGFDTVGHVIHLNNLFRNVESIGYKQMMKGTPQKLVSKFKISYNLLLNLIDLDQQEFIKFVNQSMIQLDITGEIKQYIEQINIVEKEIFKLDETIAHLKTPLPIVEEYMRCLEDVAGAVNKKKKELDKKISAFLNEYRFIDTEKNVVKKWREKQDELSEIKYHSENTTNYIQNNINMVLDFLCSEKFIEENKERKEESKSKYSLLEKGQFAVNLREVHCLVFANFYQDISLLSSKQIIIILSCFTNVSVSEDFKELIPKTEDLVVQKLVEKMKNESDRYLEKENDFNTGSDYTFHYDLLNYIGEWVDTCIDETSCKIFLQKLEREKDIFLGEFVKALLKITNIATELEQVAELQNNLEFLSKLKEIPVMLLKYVVTNQSLYI